MFLLLLNACDPWAFPDGGTLELPDEAWDPDVVAAEGGVYVRLPAAGALARVKDDGTWSEVGLDGATPERMVLAPDDETLLVFASWPVCADDDPEIVNVEDCPDEDLSYSDELDLVSGGKRVGTAVAGVSGQLNGVEFTDASATNLMAALYFDFTADNAEEIEIDGVMNLNEVVFLDLSAGEGHPVDVGFAAEAVLFASPSAETGEVEKAIVLSRSKVAVVDLRPTSSTPFAVTVSFKLVLDDDSPVRPSHVTLAEDGQYALVTTASGSDLYILDLVNEAIDIQELPAVPSAIAVDADLGATLVVFGNDATVGVIDHLYWELVTYDLEEPATAVVDIGDSFLLYNDEANYHDVVYFEPSTGDMVERRAENPIIELELASTHYAVASLRPDGGGGGGGASAFYDQSYGLGVFPLDAGDPVALALEAEPIGMAVSGTDADPYALVLMDEVEELIQVRLADQQATQFALGAPPEGIASSPDGRFVVTHTSPLGLVTFLDPDSGDTVEVAGFASLGLVTAHPLPRRTPAEEK
jgi:hypothetical protein